MKKLFFVALLCLPVMLNAHPPGDIKLGYDKDEDGTYVLSINIEHSVRNVDRHYIESITVSINDEVYEELEYSSQQSSDSHNIKLALPSGISEGDIIKVDAVCSRIGSDSAEFEF